MKKLASTLLVLILTVGCSDKEKTDEYLLEQDRKELEESLDSYKVVLYRFGKIVIRASAETDTVSSEFQAIKSDIDRIYNKILNHTSKDPNDLSLMDYVSIYRDYKKMEDFVMKTDEDIFPTVVDAFNVTYGDSTSYSKPIFIGEKKPFVQNIEHAVLSAIVILSRDLGKEVSLYECAKTKPELLGDSEVKTLLQYFRGFLFFEKGFNYLSEDEFTRNIKWLNENGNVNLPLTRLVFGWGNLDNEKTYVGMHALNHLFRGFDRLMMEREIDEVRAMEDFETFLKDAQEIGLDNELIWGVETYLHLKNEESEKAILSLQKLRTSTLISSNEREVIDESIGYLKDRKPGKVLNGIYDKFFLSKIATKYMLSVLAQVDWEQVLKEHDVPYTEEMFKTVDNFNDIIANLSKYSSEEHLETMQEDIKDKGEDLWNKAKELVE